MPTTTTHTPGRLTTRENGDANSYALLDESGDWLLSLLHNGRQLTEQQRENMRRLAACWNACDGISTEALEKGAIQDRIASACGELYEVNRQRDELLAALREYIAAADNSANPADGDDVAAMLRFADADKAARLLLLKFAQIQHTN